MRALVIGHFSTVGDIESLEYVEGLLGEQGLQYDILPYNPKYVPFIDGAVRLEAIDPKRYTHLVAVCGPFWPGLLAKWGIPLDRFEHCTRIGVNLTMVEPVADWNPFHVLLERDSTRTTRPDLTFLRTTGRVPVAGLCTIARQREYGDRQRHDEAEGLLRNLVEARTMATVEIDTRWPKHRNAGGLGSPGEVISLIEKVDILLTNRLHGMVFGLKAGVPVLAVDPVDGGDKVMAQGKILGWPAVTTVERASPDWMDRMLDWCLSPEGRNAAQSAAGAAGAALRRTHDELSAALHSTHEYQPLPRAPQPPKVRLRQRIARAVSGLRLR